MFFSNDSNAFGRARPGTEGSIDAFIKIINIVEEKRQFTSTELQQTIRHFEVRIFDRYRPIRIV